MSFNIFNKIGWHSYNMIIHFIKVSLNRNYQNKNKFNVSEYNMGVHVMRYYHLDK